MRIVITTLGTLTCLIAAAGTNAQETPPSARRTAMTVTQHPATPPLPPAVEADATAPIVEAEAFGEPPIDGRNTPGTIRGWLFRRYAGEVEMQEKVFYPGNYFGPYYFRGWKPDWVYPLPPPPDYHLDHVYPGGLPPAGEMPATGRLPRSPRATIQRLPLAKSSGSRSE